MYDKFISWDILLKIIHKTVTCPRTFDLIKSIITLNHVHPPHKSLVLQKNQLSLFSQADEPTTMVGDRKGLPIGNLTSQLFANIYLDQLDHFV